MLRDTLIATTSALVVVGAYLVSESFPPAPEPYPGESLPTALDRRIPGEVNIRGSLREAIEQLVALGCPIDVLREWNSDEADTRAPLSVGLRDATARQWLHAIGFTRGGPTPYWIGSDGRIKVSDYYSQQPPVGTRVYDVRDLIDDAMLFAEKFAQPNLGWWLESDDPRDVRWGIEWRFNEMIREIAAGTLWIPRGGGSGGPWPTVGDSDLVDGRLIITHSREVHRRIEVLLPALRAHRNRPVPVDGSR